MHILQIKQKFITLVFIIYTAIFIGCTPVITKEGYQLDLAKLKSIKLSIDNKRTVYAKLGSPSSQNTFNEKTWLYIGKTTKQKSFYSPTTLSQTVIEITFDKNNLVENITKYSLQDGQKIEPLKTKTQTLGKKLTIFEQLFGNLGRTIN